MSVELLREQPSRDRPEHARSDDDAVTSTGDQWLCCRSCGKRIASAKALLPSNEPLVFANPSGLVFELVLLREAHGLQLIGPMTQEFTWFRGYAWRVALCGGCTAHLGWRFDAVGPDALSGFFGLLRRELVESGAAD